MRKFILFVFAILLSIPGLSKELWQERLDEIKVPGYFAKGLPVYIKYKEKVDGYIVTGKFFPFDSRSETGYIILNFAKASTGESYVFKSPKDWVYTNDYLGNIAFDENGPGFEADKTYLFHYIAPGDPENKKCYDVDELHPLGYYTPFQFYDIDFDGKKELLINDWSKIKGGNTYYSFELIDNKLVPKTGAPFDELINMDKIDSKNKSITRVSEDGCFEYIEFKYVLKKTHPHNPLTYPHQEFQSWMSNSYIKDSVNTDFKLISIYEKLGDKEYRYNL